MLKQLKMPQFYLAAAIDVVLFALALAGAYFIRFDFSPPPGQVRQMMLAAALILPLKLTVFYLFGMYLGMRRYTSLSDLLRLIKATSVSSLIIFAYLLFFHRFEGFSRGVYVMDGILTLILTGGVRISMRMIHQKGLFRKIKERRRIFGPKNAWKNKRVIIVGAGDAAEKTFREIEGNPSLPGRVVAFVDDAHSKHGRSIHGVPIAGTIAELPALAGKLNADELIIAIPSATGPQMRAIVEVCERTGLPFKTLPGLGEIINDKVSVKDLRDVDYADLLGREPVVLDTERIRSYLRNKTVMVTGPGGSIGSELCRQIVRHGPKRLVLFESSEPNLYDIQMELEHRLKFRPYTPILGAVQDQGLARRVFERFRPDVVFHAAAYKHVPMLEHNPWQAVWNNVRGAQNIMSLAAECRAERFILVSSDKAVRPTSVMGASKRCCERLMHACTGSDTRFMAVRFGNVVGSAGSVVPLFRKQIALGGPVTVTHPEMTRYFMTIPEASQLILQAGALGKGGELFILEMGTPVKIADMARDLIRLSGKEPGEDIEIVFGDIRPGEKLHEELITDGEGIVPTEHEKIMMIRADARFEEFGGRQGYRSWLSERIEELYRAADACDAAAVKERLREIVPEYELQSAESVLERRGQND